MLDAALAARHQARSMDDQSLCGALLQDIYTSPPLGNIPRLLKLQAALPEQSNVSASMLLLELMLAVIGDIRTIRFLHDSLIDSILAARLGQCISFQWQTRHGREIKSRVSNNLTPFLSSPHLPSVKSLYSRIYHQRFIGEMSIFPDSLSESFQFTHLKDG